MKRLNSILRRLTNSPISVGFIVILAVVVLNRVEFLHQLNRIAYDMMVLKRGVRPIPKQVAIIDIDEPSLRALGRWPWPRQTVAELIRKLSALGARVVAFDGTFSEEDQTTGLQHIRDIGMLLREKLENKLSKREYRALVREIEGFKRVADGDRQLAATFSEVEAKVVLGYLIHFPERGLGHDKQQQTIDPKALAERVKAISRSAINMVMREVQSTTRQRRFAPVVDVATPIAPLAKTVDGFGYFNSFPNRDGTSRNMMLVHPVKDHFFPAISLAAALHWLDASAQAVYSDMGLESLQLVGRDKASTIYNIPLDENGRIYINYYGPLRTLPYFSAVDVLRDEVAAEQVKDKVVFIGSSAPSVFDLLKVPFEVFRGWETPGVEVQATLTANIINQDYLKSSFAYNLLLLLLLPVILVFVIRYTGALPGLLLTIAFGLGEVGFAYWLLAKAQTIVWVGIPLITLLILYTAVTLAKYRSEEVRRRFIKHAFSHYLSPVLVDQISTNPELLNLGGERKVLSVLFSDIRDFTSLSEKLTPTALHELLSSYLTPMTDIITRHNMGTLDKYIGDAIMAFFGAPIGHEEHAKAACKSALEMMEELRQLNKREDTPRLDVGIGINTGEVSVGNMGSQSVFDYTAIGDGVNLASRLEGITKQYGVPIVVSATTRFSAGEDFIFRELDRITVKGRDETVTIYQLRRFTAELDGEEQELIQLFEQGLNLYRTQAWLQATECFQNCLRIDPQDEAANIFVQRCSFFKHNPPEAAWDGVYRFFQK